MKKLVLTLMMVSVLASFAGCGNETKDVDTSVEETEAVVTVATTDEEVSDTVVDEEVVTEEETVADETISEEDSSNTEVTAETEGDSSGVQKLVYDKQCLHDIHGVSNIRQLGGYVNKDGKVIKQDVLIRSGNLVHCTPDSQALLSEKYHVSDIIDFRSDKEIESMGEDVEVDGAEYHHIEMNTSKEGQEFLNENPELGKKMMELGKAASETHDDTELTLFRADIGIISVDSAVNYLLSDEAAEKYGEFFKILLDKPEDSAIVFHCTGGKDRTGLASTLLLYALDFDEDVIKQDYMLTNEANAEKIEKLMEAGKEYKDDEEFLYNLYFANGVYEEVYDKLVNGLIEQSGSVRDYLINKVGLTEDDIVKLKDIYLE